MADTVKVPYISSLQVKGFRCFDEKTLLFEAPIILIEGNNGTGKTSLVEALHFVCYVRSFRTSMPRDIVTHNKPGFFIRIGILNHIFHEDVIQVGFSGSRRLVKINDQAVTSYKQLIDLYRVVTITEDDLDLIKGGPTARRQFIDQAMTLQNPSWSAYFKKAVSLTEQRSQALYAGICTPALYEVWTEGCWNFSSTIQKMRTDYLKTIEAALQHLLQISCVLHEIAHTVQLSYKPKKNTDYAAYTDFLHAYPTLMGEEIRSKRSLFGFHLDDVEITINGRNARHFASRGQQKLILLLLKAAQISILPPSHGPTVIILDDFITDLDATHTQQLLQLFITLGTQLIVTIPRKDTMIHTILASSRHQYQVITL